MNKPLYLFICILGFGAIALGLFVVENRVENMRDDLAEIDRQIHADKEAIHVLKAEWAYLTRPERIASLSKQYLKLEPVQSAQIVTPKQLQALIEKQDHEADVASITDTKKATQ